MTASRDNVAMSVQLRDLQAEGPWKAQVWETWACSHSDFKKVINQSGYISRYDDEDAHDDDGATS